MKLKTFWAMHLRDTFEVFCNRGATTFRGVPKRAIGGMDAKSWRKMLADSKVYKTPKALANGVLIFSEVCGRTQVMDFDQFKEALAKVGERKGMTGSDIGAYLSHMADGFHAAVGGSLSRQVLSKEQMKAAIKQREKEQSKQIPLPQPAPPVEKSKKAQPAAAPVGGATPTEKKVAASQSDAPKPPNLKEIAKQNQALDAQKEVLRQLNSQLASGLPLSDESEDAQKGGNNGFSWDRKEKFSVKLRENATSWDWHSVEGHREPPERKKKRK